jgi:hypothetical protein
MKRPGIDIDRSKSLHRAQLVALRDHRKLQEEHGNASCRDGQKSLRDPRNQICAVHVCIPVDWSNRQQNASPAESQQTHYLTDR